IPVLWWRSVGNTHTAFAMEGMIDEAAHAAGADPLAYRLALLKEKPRHAATLALAADKAGWSSPPPPGRARGLAVHESFRSVLALSACGAKPAASTSGTGGPASGGPAGLVAFETVRGVLQHTRCQNCHPRGDTPLQGDDGRPHLQNVQRGPDGHGMVGERCTT